MVTILEANAESNLLARVVANANAEAGLILRFHDAQNYLVALYTPSLKALYLHDRQHGEWGPQLGRVEVPEIGPSIRLAAAVCGSFAAAVLSDGRTTFRTPVVAVSNHVPGPPGLWLYQIGNRQGFSRFELCHPAFALAPRKTQRDGHRLVWSSDFQAPEVPSPQDWVLILSATTTSRAAQATPTPRLSPAPAAEVPAPVESGALQWH